MLKVRNLTKVYDNGVKALDDVSFDVKEGEFLAVIGLSGSGKSTLLRCINMLIEPTSGSIEFQGIELTKLKGKALRDVRVEIGMIFQQFNLVKRKTVLQNVLSGGLGKVSTLKGFRNSASPSELAKANENLKLVGLEEKALIRASELSGGQQQRVAIARSLYQNSKMLLADEPVASLDPSTSHAVMDYLKYANQKLGKTILCNLHFLSLVREYSTSVIALKGGKLVFQGGPLDITEQWFQEIYGDQAKEVEIH